MYPVLWLCHDLCSMRCSDPYLHHGTVLTYMVMSWCMCSYTWLCHDRCPFWDWLCVETCVHFRGYIKTQVLIVHKCSNMFIHVHTGSYRFIHVHNCHVMITAHSAQVCLWRTENCSYVKSLPLCSTQLLKEKLYRWLHNVLYYVHRLVCVFVFWIGNRCRLIVVVWRL